MATEISRRPLLSVVIPCYNELATIENILDRVFAQSIKDIEVILVDDCSTDGTRGILPRICAQRGVKVVMHQSNQGKGAALKTGFQIARGTIILVQDADLEYDPNEYHLIIDPIVSRNADVVFGSRFMGGRPHRVVYFWHMLGNKFLTLLSNIFTNINLTDMETCYKAFRREVIQNIDIHESRFGFEPEITAKVAKMGLRIYEVGISYYGRTYKEGKKIGWRDGVRAIYAILKYNLFK
jgi:glycosyltransferase involved in cell wall biosynthesis